MTIEMKKNRKQSDKSTKMTMIVKVLEENPDNTGDFKCKKCKRRFKTYQALGGHQASHKKILQPSQQEDALCFLSLNIVSSGLYRCKICSKGFDTGQALGGHMRLHKPEKALNVIDQEKEGGLWRQEAVEVKKESDLVLMTLEVHRVEAEENERIRVRRELILASKEWQLCL